MSRLKPLTPRPPLPEAGRGGEKCSSFTVAAGNRNAQQVRLVGKEDGLRHWQWMCRASSPYKNAEHQKALAATTYLAQ
jgi:hypothetical protein